MKFFNAHSKNRMAAPANAIPSGAGSPTRVSRLGVFCIMNSTCLPVAMGLMLAMCGCNKKKEAPTTVPGDAKQASPASPASLGANLKPVNPNDPAEAQEAARRAAFLAISRGMLPPPPALKLKGGEPATPEVLQAYNVMLLRAMAQEGESLESLEQLNQKMIQKLHLLPRLPTPPPGKRIIYDVRNRIICLDPP